MKKNLTYWLRWLLLLPGSLLVGFLMTFPLHWLLYLVFAKNGTLLGIIELPPGSNIPIEIALTPFIIAITFVLVGFKIAPKHKFIASIVLTILWLTTFIGIVIFVPKEYAQLQLRGMGSILGSLIGLYIARIKSLEQKNITQSSESNLKVTLGKDTNNQDYSIDFLNQNINLTLLVGSSGTGKSVLGYHIYQQLVKQNSPEEINFVLIDNVHLEFTQWNQKSPYLYCPNITDQDKAFEVLESIENQIDQINSGTKHYFIHIEECNQFASDTERMKQIFQKLFQNKSDSKIHLIFSTSRPSKEIFTDWLLEISDLKIIFKLPKPEDYITIAGEDFSKYIKDSPGDKIACLRDEFIQLLPLSVEEVVSVEKFRL